MVALRRRGAAPPGDEVLRGHGGEQQRDLQHRRGPEHRHDRTAGTCPETKSTCTKVSAKINLGDSYIYISNKINIGGLSLLSVGHVTPQVGQTR